MPGESFLAVLDGFHAYGERIRFIVNRQEGGAAFMAEAHGKLSGRPGICFVTRGPGATNASIGVHTAFQDSTPMILFVGDVGSDFRDREAFQEVDYGSFFGPSTKGFAKRVERIDDAEPHSRVRRARLRHGDERPARARWCWCCPRTCCARRLQRGRWRAWRRSSPGAIRARCARCASCC